MPHVIVKLWKGKSEAQKIQLTEAITEKVCEILKYEDTSVSVAIEEFDPGRMGRSGVQARYRAREGKALQRTRLRRFRVIEGLRKIFSKRFPDRPSRRAERALLRAQ